MKFSQITILQLEGHVQVKAGVEFLAVVVAQVVNVIEDSSAVLCTHFEYPRHVTGTSLLAI
jgi:hypothetical protein